MSGMGFACTPGRRCECGATRGPNGKQHSPATDRRTITLTFGILYSQRSIGRLVSSSGRWLVTSVAARAYTQHSLPKSQDLGSCRCWADQTPKATLSAIPWKQAQDCQRAVEATRESIA